MVNQALNQVFQWKHHQEGVSQSHAYPPQQQLRKGKSDLILLPTVHVHMIFNVFPDLKVRFGLQISLLAIKRKKQALNLKQCTLKMRFHN